ncbi:bifunctional hydroxymethylpyrimidine kinase/phosphomethylpyrimidine kinase [Paenibacillus sp. N1-5-1-14]|uniref:bifunctional hydroxymethylpyrimidine kinase/phosphomethylpyrimidine kinase n=1 Tax=Paenibacillus radicibacter TaxID=2972488 RepID=UPI00215959F4|nr:bifunctional hydroxymethylpyrimidine kinase/phosphomethylpyrimidine kinase [Paenibacillus radicibacter]MCR8644976.1 bifunctional hydroxymethylpyrimidine kinase/phosphomethylpyrimidine kinase [Paenibacillus radicibacter]
MIAKALTIAGSDSGGGAGIQADLKTFQELGVYGMTAITAITAQNTLGVHAVAPMTPELVINQIQSVVTDLRPDAIKTGMLHNSEIIQATVECIREYDLRNIVVDPVMIAKGGASLLAQDAITALIKHLLPLTDMITPNIPEAEALTGLTIHSMNDRMEACRHIYAYGVRYVLIKGGHDAEEQHSATDLLYDGEVFITYTEPRIATKHTHGTGCTFSAAITACLAQGDSIPDAVKTAKAFIQAAITDSLNIGQGHGPTNHFAYYNHHLQKVGHQHAP